MCGWRWTGRAPVEFYSRVGGNVPSAEEVLALPGTNVSGSLPQARHEEALIHG